MMRTMPEASTTHVTTLVQFLVNTYFSQLSSVLVVHDAGDDSELHGEYLLAVQQAFRNQSRHGNLIGLQWIDVDSLSNDDDDDDDDDDKGLLEHHMLNAVNDVTEGFITILANTFTFLHARYYSTRYAELRLKDKFYLFLCELENPRDFLTAEILQFYPHHLMVAPTKSETNEHSKSNESETGNKSTLRGRTTRERTMTMAGRQPEPATATPATSATNTITKKTLNKFCALSEPPPIHPLRRAMASRVPALAEPEELRTAIGNETTTCTHRDINFGLWTQKFVGSVGNLDAVLLDAFLPNETFAQHVELYPNKLLDLQGRALRVGSITYIPYVVTNYVHGMGNTDPIDPKDLNASVFYVGSEAELVKTFCEIRNCHLRVQPYGVDNWGVIYENDTSSGMLGDIYTQRVELAIGCIYNWYNEITETSHTIARSAVTLLGPGPAQFPTWRTPIMPFTVQLWLFLMFTMIFCALMFYLIKLSAFHMKRKVHKHQFRHLKTIELAILDIFAIYIQQPSAPSNLHRFAARIFMATLLCATITLENTYSGQLKSILTIPFYTEPVDTMDKWAQTDWQWAAPSIIWVQTIEGSKLTNDQILTRKFAVRDYDFLYNASFRSDYGLGIERLMSGSFSFGEFITAPALDTKIVAKDDLYFDWTRAVSIRGWPLMPLFNEHVLTCMETGLFVHWERNMVAQYLDRQTQEIMLKLASGYASKLPPQKLTVTNISGALFVLLFGYLIAGWVLLLEMFRHQLKFKYSELKIKFMSAIKMQDKLRK